MSVLCIPSINWCRSSRCTAEHRLILKQQQRTTSPKTQPTTQLLNPSHTQPMKHHTYTTYISHHHPSHTPSQPPRALLISSLIQSISNVRSHSSSLLQPRLPLSGPSPLWSFPPVSVLFRIPSRRALLRPVLPIPLPSLPLLLVPPLVHPIHRRRSRALQWRKAWGGRGQKKEEGEETWGE